MDKIIEKIDRLGYYYGDLSKEDFDSLSDLGYLISKRYFDAHTVVKGEDFDED